MRGKPIDFSEAELVFIETLRSLPRRLLHRAFCDWTGRSDVSQAALSALCKRKGWLTGRDGRFEKGSAAHNKGKPFPTRGRSAEGHFKKGRLPHNTRGAGHERIDTKDGYVILIVDETNPWTGAATRPVLKHRYLWEKKNGPVPDGHVLKCWDGDKTNTDPDNWFPVVKGLVPRLSGPHAKNNFDEAPMELKQAILTTALLAQAVSDARRKRKERQG